MSHDNTSPLIPLAQYCAARGVSDRTVKRWLADGEIAGARKDESGRWLVPADADRTIPVRLGPDPLAEWGGNAPTPPLAPEVTGSDSALVTIEARPRISELVEHLTGYVPLSIAAEALGIRESAIRRHRDRYALEAVGGANGQELMMTRAKLKEILG